MKAAEFLKMKTQVSEETFVERPQGLSTEFSALCDGNCGDGVCGQCN